MSHAIKSNVVQLRRAVEYDTDDTKLQDRKINNATRRINRAALRTARKAWLEDRDYN